MFNTAEANQQDTNNYDVSRSGIGKAAEIPDRIASLYHLVYQRVLPTLGTHQREVSAMLSLTLNAKHLILGINSLYRLYSSQMFREARSACESTGIAHLILKDSKACDAFTKDRINDDQARRRARNQFKPEKIFAGVNPYLLRLQQRYAEASVRAHTNFMSSMKHVHTAPMDEQSNFSMIEINPERADETIKTYLHWSCLVHMEIIDAVTMAIFPEFDSNAPEFQSERNAIDQIMDQLQEHVARLSWARKQPGRKPA
ncbi:MAG TPA: hypothetical protein VG168_02915 [Bryobacteraceae bacterium]|jgi:hypothetical protein|nr:hypothetical protein [Bryobacteraceae bacterium]